MRQQVNVTVKLTLSIPAEQSEEEIGVYVRNNLYNTFHDQAGHVDGNTMVDILDIKQEAEIFETENKKYTVLLLYPSSMTDGNTETYCTCIEAVDAAEAIEAAQLALADEHPGSDFMEFDCLFCLEGEHQDLSAA